MAKLIRVEKDYHYYAVDLTDEQYKMYQDDPDAFWENEDLQEELYDEMELARSKDGGTDFYVED
jgi:hypothetical protein